VKNYFLAPGSASFYTGFRIAEKSGKQSEGFMPGNDVGKNDVAKRAEKFVKAGLVQKFGKKQAEEIIAKNRMWSTKPC
jgi:hypothetical protein